MIGIKSKTTFTKTRNSLLLSLSFLNVWCLSRCSRVIFLTRWCEVEYTTKTEGFLFFMALEMTSFVSYILSCIVFLVTRSFTKHKLPVEPEVPDEKRLPDCDFMIGCFAIADTFINAAYPFFASIVIIAFPLQTTIPDGTENVDILNTFS